MPTAPSTNYTQGYSPATTSSHASRTAQSDAGFLLPHLQPTSHILDIGCGPATITVGLAALVPQGSVTGVELTEDILALARQTVASTVPRVSNVTLVKGDVLSEGGLPFKDGSFDVVFSSQLFPHLRGRDAKLKALSEMRRVLKPGGILATRDAAELHFYPTKYGLDGLWAGNVKRVLGGRGKEGGEDEEGGFPGGQMKGLYRAVGFDDISVGGGTTVFSSTEARKWYVNGCLGRLSEGDTYRESWVKAGIKEGEIEETRRALQAWGEDEDAWYAALQAEVVGRK
ncbi:S-adenosyl-L-methionine-dependent methyltransferase [Cercophora newfieldiana]|uniref:S-adenosyl-L-methionine-dependent methyltransferase n=1 Tax=Cercophora newfieldiana TaxID=92897 RepID=A0AA39YSR5_9PEZI|nr:S-adenosyl-L-methionine-dependent methyltransferase [Cercophora newfieldiana]